MCKYRPASGQREIRTTNGRNRIAESLEKPADGPFRQTEPKVGKNRNVPSRNGMPPARPSAGCGKIGLIVMSFADGRLSFLARSCRGVAGFSGRFMLRGHFLCCLRLPPCASAIRAPDAAGESSASGLKHCRTARRKAKPTPTALGCCVGCATKKASKEVAGNGSGLAATRTIKSTILHKAAACGGTTSGCELRASATRRLRPVR